MPSQSSRIFKEELTRKRNGNDDLLNQFEMLIHSKPRLQDVLDYLHHDLSQLDQFIQEFAIFSVKAWSICDALFDYKIFYFNIIAVFENEPENPWVQETLHWWNDCGFEEGYQGTNGTGSIISCAFQPPRLYTAHAVSPLKATAASSAPSPTASITVLPKFMPLMYITPSSMGKVALTILIFAVQIILALVLLLCITTLLVMLTLVQHVSSNLS
ncbi:hypothetical protein H0H87_010311 [Tephrocybe sp. NHM501043]|nr:hypothetical protein H0H87_010311 [Tephrocybe sp. NHM501043]